MSIRNMINQDNSENGNKLPYLNMEERLSQRKKSTTQLRRVNYGLGGLNVLLVCVVIYSLHIEIRNNSVHSELKGSAHQGEIISETERVESKRKKEYLAVLNKRNIFVNYRDEMKRRKLTKKKAIKEEGKSLDQIIRLNGIIYKRIPVVIIEDLELKEVLFLKAGDTVQDAEIEEITKEKVIFKYKNRSVEIEL